MLKIKRQKRFYKTVIFSTKANNKDSSLYIYFEFTELDSMYCFNEQIESTPMETFFLDTIADYFYRESIYLINKRNNRLNNFLKTYCENEKNKIGKKYEI